jgi:hypothetical protein
MSQLETKRSRSVYSRKHRIDVCHALATLILKREIPEEKRNLIFVPEKLMKNDLNGVLSNGLMKHPDLLPWKRNYNKGAYNNDYNYLSLFHSGNESQFAHTLNNYLDNKIGLPTILSIIKSLQDETRTVKLKTLSGNDEIVDTKATITMPVLIESGTKSGKLCYYILTDAITEPKPKDIIADCPPIVVSKTIDNPKLHHGKFCLSNTCHLAYKKNEYYELCLIDNYTKTKTVKDAPIYNRDFICPFDHSEGYDTEKCCFKVWNNSNTDALIRYNDIDYILSSDHTVSYSFFKDEDRLRSFLDSISCGGCAFIIECLHTQNCVKESCNIKWNKMEGHNNDFTPMKKKRKINDVQV